MMKPGDSINNRSTFNLVEEGPSGCAILSDQWGILYVIDENGKVQYVGDNVLRAEITFWLSAWNPDRDS